jgi:hypothetical protein
VTPRAVGPAQEPQWTSSGRRMSMALIGLAVASRLARDTRAQETVIVAVIVVAAMAGMGKAGRAGAFARLVAWDKRQTSELRRTLTAAERKAAKHIPAI